MPDTTPFRPRDGHNQSEICSFSGRVVGRPLSPIRVKSEYRHHRFAIIGLLVLAVGYLVVDGVQTGETVKAIAVLPFVNMSNDPEQEFFSDGISEELLNVLAKVQGLRVTSRTSAFSFKGTNTPIPEVAAALGVQYVLEGSLRLDSGQVRITPRLVDVATDSQLWSETYDLGIENIFALQDQIADRVSEALEVELLGADATPLEPVRQTSPEVYVDYLLARELPGNPTYVNLSRSVDLLANVIARDPDYAPAFAALAMTYSLMAQWGQISSQEAYQHMRVLVPSALALDDTLAEAWIMQEKLAWIEGNRAAADVARERALELGPENPNVLVEAITYLSRTRNPEPARRLVDELMRVDPLGPWSLRAASDFYSRAGESARARELLERIRTVSSDLIQYYWGLSTQGHLKDEIVEIRNLIEEAYRIDSSDAEGPGYLAQISVDLGDMETASRWSAEALELIPNHAVSLLSAMYLALVQNDTDQAIRVAELLVGQNIPGRMGSKALALGVLANRDLSGGRPEDAIARYLRTYPGLAINQIPILAPQDSWWYVDASMYAALDLAGVYGRAGDTEKSEALLEAVEEELPYWPRIGMWGIGFADVEFYALRGETDEALQALQAAMDEGSWRIWRWRLLHNPNLETLQGDSRFKAIVDQIEARMARELSVDR